MEKNNRLQQTEEEILKKEDVSSDTLHEIERILFGLLEKDPNKDEADAVAEALQEFQKLQEKMDEPDPENELNACINLYNDVFMRENVPIPDDPEETVYAVLNMLQNTDREILLKRYGLHGNAPETFKKIGEYLKISTERVSWYYKNILEKLRTGSFRTILTKGIKQYQKDLKDNGKKWDNDEELAEFLSKTSVKILDLSTITKTALRRSGISNMAELFSRTDEELLRIRNFGQQSLANIKREEERFCMENNIDHGQAEHIACKFRNMPYSANNYFQS